MSKFKNFKFKLAKIIKNFSITEKVVFSLLIIVLILSTFSSLIKVNATFLKEIPQRGGVIKEGLIGTPRFINPVIAISETDRDISSLIYSGLLKIDSNGDIVNELAESFNVSEDGLVYSLKIRDDAFFHDGEAVTVDDLIYTIQKTQDPTVKSPKRPNWDGVVIEKINDKEIEFILNQPYAPFIYNLMLGILPEHIWSEIPSEEFAFTNYNVEPIGSGPYLISDVDKDRGGIVQKYVLKSFENYTLEEPFIEKIEFRFYKNEEEIRDALNKDIITSAHSVSPQNINLIDQNNKNISISPFSRSFAIYFNQAESDVLANNTVRAALKLATPRQEVIDNILAGYASPIESPLPIEISKAEKSSQNIDAAIELLINDGWEANEEGILIRETDDSILTLKFDISTANVAELVEVTELITENYKKLGADVNVKIFEPNDLTLNVIRPRDFEAIFFGQVINRDLDFYAFWHSSQRNDPGLNIAGFTNIDADAALDNVRTISDTEERNSALQIFEKEVINDVPAIFLYSPDFIYIVSKDLNLEVPKTIVTSSDRFADIHKWYIETELVWEFFAK
jgi:peptide/nickel transport system substrate-binding protein